MSHTTSTDAPAHVALNIEERLKVQSGPFKGKPAQWFTRAQVIALLAGSSTEAPPPPRTYAGAGMFEGESVSQAAEGWAQWCDARGMTGLPEFLRKIAANAAGPVEPSDELLQLADRSEIWARQVSEQPDVPKGIREAGANLAVALRASIARALGNPSVEAPVPTQPVAVRTFTPEEARRGFAIRGDTKHYCCYGMYCDAGHTNDCKHSGAKACGCGQPAGTCSSCSGSRAAREDRQ